MKDVVKHPILFIITVHVTIVGYFQTIQENYVTLLMDCGQVEKFFKVPDRPASPGENLVSFMV